MPVPTPSNFGKAFTPAPPRVGEDAVDYAARERAARILNARRVEDDGKYVSGSNENTGDHNGKAP